MVSNPEFLKEGAAVDDFMRPDRIVIGTEPGAAGERARDADAPALRAVQPPTTTACCSWTSQLAEFTKYAANAMLATRISFMNELANLADELGADIEQVRQGIGTDPRIGYGFLYAGTGYGGSCFPKDVQALIRTAARARPARCRCSRRSRRSTTRRSTCWSTRSSRASAPTCAAGRFALWGLAFKPNTDDMREAPSRVMIKALLRARRRASSPTTRWR